MIVVALPQVARDLKVEVAETSWIVTSYLIAMAALQPIAGRVGDRLGRRNVMLAALVYFALASAGAAAANSILVLAVFRINQAIAAAALVPNGLGLLRGAIPSGRGRGAPELRVASSRPGASALALADPGVRGRVRDRRLPEPRHVRDAPRTPGRARRRERAQRHRARRVLGWIDHPRSARRARRRSLRTAP